MSGRLGSDTETGNVVFIRTRNPVGKGLSSMFDTMFEWFNMDEAEAERYFKLFFSRVKSTRPAEGLDIDSLAKEFGRKVKGELTVLEIERHLLQCLRRPEEAITTLPITFGRP